MNLATQRALAEHNRRFYDAHASTFSATREDPWPGWTRVLAPTPVGPNDRLRVLDVGCGNARFARWLREVCASRIDYTGIDACESLLAAARERCPNASLHQADLVEQPLDTALPAGPFDLVCAFGLLHHIPGFARRRALVEALADRVAAGGRLALAFWRFGEHERFSRRLLDWSEAATIDPAELEPGDHLLAWGDAGAARYCHASDDAEMHALVDTVALELCDDFESDGRGGKLNRYLVLERADG